MIAAIAAFLAPLRGPLMWLALAVALTFGSLLYGFVKGEAHVQAKWDAALTIPAAQPIRTLAGYPATAARLRACTSTADTAFA